MSYRIVSLCPSTSATLIDFGLADEIVGRTTFCIHPQEIIEKIPRVGGTKNPKFDKIRALQPTHIMFNLEENDVSHLEEMQSIAETIVTTPIDMDSTLEMNLLFGNTFHRVREASNLNLMIETQLNQIRAIRFKPFRYLYFIWNEPRMVVGKNTYIDSMLSLFGGKNAAAEVSEERYLSLSKEEIEQLNVDQSFLSSEPFPFKEKHIELYQFSGKSVKLIDGEMCSWHGSYTVKGLGYLINYFLADEKTA